MSCTECIHFDKAGFCEHLGRLVSIYDNEKECRHFQDIEDEEQEAQR